MKNRKKKLDVFLFIVSEEKKKYIFKGNNYPN